MLFYFENADLYTSVISSILSILKCFIFSQNSYYQTSTEIIPIFTLYYTLLFKKKSHTQNCLHFSESSVVCTNLEMIFFFSLADSVSKNKLINRRCRSSKTGMALICSFTKPEAVALKLQVLVLFTLIAKPQKLYSQNDGYSVKLLPHTFF